MISDRRERAVDTLDPCDLEIIQRTETKRHRNWIPLLISIANDR